MIGTSTTVSSDFKGIAALKRKLRRLEAKKIEWGFLEGQHSEADMTYAALAWMLEMGVRQENGTGWEIPPRPAFRQSIQELRVKGGFERHAKPYLRAYLSPSGGGNIQPFLDSSGKFLANSYKDSMINWRFNGSAYRHNAKLTIQLKGFDRPYVETGELTQNVQYDIK